MKLRSLFLAICLATAPAIAQQSPDAEAAPGAVLRALDRVAGTLVDIEMETGRTARQGRLEITLQECRYPTANPASDAYALLMIRDTKTDELVFSGWMVASSPALNALDHPRYDVWVLRCSTP